MDYNKLYTFTKVVECGGISRAARVLRRTQSAITQQVQQLEAELSLQLFERRPPRLVLSREGASLNDLARRVLGEIDDLVATLRDDVQMARGRLRIAALSDYSTELDVTNLVAKFRMAHPAVDVAVTAASNERVEELIRAGEVDLGIAIVFAARDELERHELASATHGLVAARSYLERRGPVRTYRDVIEAELIDFNDGFLCLGPWLGKNKPELKAALLRRSPNLVLPDHRATRAAVLAGLGLAVVPLHLIAKELAAGTVTRIIPAASDVRVGLDIACLRGRDLRLIERLFWDMAIAASPGKASRG